MLLMQGKLPGFCGFCLVRRAEDQKVRNGAQRCNLFHRLVVGPSSPTPIESCVRT